MVFRLGVNNWGLFKKVKERRFDVFMGNGLFTA
ncbi:Uncharacterised protein [Streptococcus pneumoniae]|nr:Uncharacterised protein [Streptococcus pneumoniae]